MQVHLLDPSSITIPPDRFRQADPAKVKEIAESFSRYGQFHPILITRDQVLIAGLHRIFACKSLGVQIAAVYRDEVDELYLREMELEENIRRSEMSWVDRAKAITVLHDMKKKLDPNWGQVQTAEIIGSARAADISDAVNVSKMIELFPEIGEAKSMRQAVSWANAKAKSILRMAEVKSGAIDYSYIEHRLLQGDSVELIKTVASNSFHAIITDPPFGIDYDRLKIGSEGTTSSYVDTEKGYLRLLSMADDLYRVLKPDGWLIWFLGPSWLQAAKERFILSGFIVDEMPIIWDRSDGKCFTQRPDRYFGRGYDMALHCIKGNPEVCPGYRSRPNVLRFPPISNSEREALVERPIELYAELIKRLTYPGETVADFFVGSGSVLAAAAQLGRDFFGCEQDGERRALALTKIKANLPDRSQQAS
jgi:ParB/RepB/Spo0J family partition protein